MCRLSAAAAVLLLYSQAAQAAGFAQNERLFVMAQTQELAEQVRERATEMVQDLEQEWLGGRVPADAKRISIHVEIDENRDEAITMPAPRRDGRLQRVFVVTSRDKMEGVLQHELTHAVLANAVPDGLPAWADEGAASQVDGAHRIRAHRETIASFERRGNWPTLRVLFEQALGPDDLEAYAASASVTAFLLAQRDRSTFLQFAQQGRDHGWDGALERFYGLRSVEHLQAAWTAAAARQKFQPAAATRRATDRRGPNAARPAVDGANSPQAVNGESPRLVRRSR